MAEQETQIQLVTFQISEELYGVDIMDVKEDRSRPGDPLDSQRSGLCGGTYSTYAAR